MPQFFLNFGNLFFQIPIKTFPKKSRQFQYRKVSYYLRFKAINKS